MPDVRITAETQRGKGRAKTRRRQALLFVNGKLGGMEANRLENSPQRFTTGTEDTKNVEG